MFGEIGAAGLRLAIEFSCANANFFRIFRDPNLLSLSPDSMCWLAGLYAIVGSVFYVAAMFLGELHPKGRTLSLWLAMPCAAFYPVVMGSLTRTVDLMRLSESGPSGIVLAFAAAGGVGVVFYLFTYKFMAVVLAKSGERSSVS